MCKAPHPIDILRECADLIEHIIVTPGYGADGNSRDEAWDHIERARAAIEAWNNLDATERPKPAWSWSTDICGLEILSLGIHDIGRVSASGGRNNKPRWFFRLNGSYIVWRTEKTVERARAALLAAAEEWLQGSLQ